MLPAEAKLAAHLHIVMHDWPREAKQNTIDHVLAALVEQRTTERDACAMIADEHAAHHADNGSMTDASIINVVADAIRNRT